MERLGLKMILKTTRLDEHNRKKNLIIETWGSVILRGYKDEQIYQRRLGRNSQSVGEGGHIVLEAKESIQEGMIKHGLCYYAIK